QQLPKLSFGDLVATQPVQTVAAAISDAPDPAAVTALINQPSYQGLRPLHKACLRGDVALVDLLLMHGAEVDAVTEESAGSETPLHCAAKSACPEAIDSLLRARADASLLDSVGRHAVHHAAAAGSVSCLLYLEEALHLPDLALRDSAGRTPVHYAVRHGRQQVLRFLLRRSRCSAMLADAEGNTPMHLAGEHGQAHMCYLLLQSAGFRCLQAQNCKKQSPLDHTNARVQAMEGVKADTTEMSRARTFLMMLSFTHSMLNVKGIMLVMWLQILCTPAFLMTAPLLAGRWLPQWEATFITCGFLAAVATVLPQGDRINNATQIQNPVLLGAALACFAHSAGLYVYRYQRSAAVLTAASGWLPSIILTCGICWALLLLRLLLLDHGTLPAGPEGSSVDDSSSGAASLVQLVRDRRSIDANFCLDCERPRLGAGGARLHCDLCGRCADERWRHSRCVLRCLARQNLRSFAAFLTVGLTGLAASLAADWAIYREKTDHLQDFGSVRQIRLFFKIQPWVLSCAAIQLIAACLALWQLGRLLLHVSGRGRPVQLLRFCLTGRVTPTGAASSTNLQQAKYV
uniref:ANK_REP_REGION domain-containing protein n=2 Tax=Macrostomum lignano TaxID=282301 RepID=A0A1I8GDM7_9PLAT